MTRPRSPFEHEAALHINEWRVVGRLLDKHKEFCTSCKPNAPCLDAARTDVLLSGLSEWVTPEPRYKVRGRTR